MKSELTDVNNIFLIYFKVLKILFQMYTDGLFLWSLDTTVRLHFEYSIRPVYQYVFGYRGSTSFSKLYGDPVHNKLW